MRSKNWVPVCMGMHIIGLRLQTKIRPVCEKGRERELGDEACARTRGTRTT